MKKIIVFFVFCFLTKVAAFSVTADITGPHFACAGSSVTLIAILNNCTGCVINSYQWKKGGTDIIGATSSTYTIISTAASDSGHYSVVITYNTTNTATSSSYALTIISIGAASSSPNVCVGTPLTITYIPVITGTGLPVIVSSSGLPTGVSASWALDTIKIHGTPSVVGPYNYSISFGGANPNGNCIATGMITIRPTNTITPTSSTTQTICINNPISNITYSSTGGSGASFSGLPPGVTGNYSAGIITISGTPIQSGTFNFSVTLTGGCGNVTKTGTINVTAYNTVTAASSSPTICLGTTIANITHSTSGATGIANDGTAGANGLPPGVLAHWNGNLITISGVPTDSGTFHYSILLIGGCGTTNAVGTISVTPLPTLNLSGGALNQTLCSGAALTPIVFTYGGSATSLIANSLPPGLTSNINTVDKTITISGIPTQTGTFTVTTVSPCTNVTLSDTITIIPLLNPSIIVGDNSVCGNQQGVAYSIDSVNNATYSWNVAGGTIANGDGTNHIIVNWILADTTGTISVNVTDNTTGCPTVQTLSVSISQLSAYNLNNIVPKINSAGDPYILIYPNPPVDNLYYQWCENGIAINGANEQFFYPPNYNLTLHPSSCYSVFVALSSYHDCGNYTNCYYMPGGKSFRLTVFPNPSDGNFTLNFNDETSLKLAGSEVNICNLDGKIVYAFPINNSGEYKMSLKLRNGFYFIKLITGEGNIYLEKLIVN
jgi:hypothetical protein